MTEVSSTEVELWGIDGSIILYGVMADLMLVLPLVLYLVLEDTNSWAQYHQTYINMLFSAYAPLGISWFIVLADDSQAARTALTGAIEMAGLGPFALLWVGYATFMMSAKSGAAFVSANTMVWIWSIIYPIVNIGLIVMHYHLSPPMYAWLAVAPMMANPIDSAKPWSLPVAKEEYTAPAEEEQAPEEAATPADVEIVIEAEVEVETRAEGDADFDGTEAEDSAADDQGWL